MIISFETDMPKQIVFRQIAKAQVRQLLTEHPDQYLHCLLFGGHHSKVYQLTAQGCDYIKSAVSISFNSITWL